MKFFMHAVGEGGRSAGCDYTISCNETFLPLKAKTEEVAREEIRHLVLKDGDYGGYFHCDKITLICCEKLEEMPVKEWTKEYKQEKSKKDRQEALAEAKKKYEKLLAESTNGE